jgi:glycerol kinase
MERDAGVPLDRLRVDGGMTDNELLMQCQADLLDGVVVRPAVRETTALGAAYAAGLATGVYDGLDDLRDGWVADRTWTPRMADDVRQMMLGRWTRAVSRAVDWES